MTSFADIGLALCVSCPLPRYVCAHCLILTDPSGEDYDGHGGCVKYTDKWAERLVEGRAPEQWGDKWLETFKDGKGAKHGEVWSAGSGGER